MSIEQIPDSATGHAQECASSQTIEESTHDHSLNILRYRAWNEPDKKESERADVDISAAIELERVSKLRYGRNGRGAIGITSDNGLRNSGPTPTSRHH